MRLLKRITMFIIVICCSLTLFGVGYKVNAASVEYEECDFGVGTFLITTTKSDKKYYLPTDATSSSPVAFEFDNVNEIDDSNLWTVTSVGTDEYYIKNSSGDYLYTINSNSGIRIGNTQSSWIYSTNNSLKSVNTNRFIGIYLTQDWRSYNSADHSNYNGSGKALAFYRVKVTSYYDVLFNSNGGSSVASQNIKENEKVTMPTNPIRDGFTFLGWYNGDVEWNFEEDKVTSNLTLTAKWFDNALSTMKTNLDLINSYMSLGYKYTINETMEQSFVKVTNESDINNGDSVIIVSKYEDKYYALSNTFENSAFTAIEVVLSDSGEILVAGSENIAWLLSSNSNGWNLTNGTTKIGTTNSSTDMNNSGTPLKLEIESSTKTYFRISGSSRSIMYRNSNSGIFKHYGSANYGDSGYASESYVFVKKNIKMISYNNVDFRIRCGIDKSILSVVTGLEGAVYGLEVSDGTTFKEYSSTDTLYQVEVDENGKAYVIIKLGDVLNNKSRLDTEFKVRAYVKYDGEKYYSAKFKNYSIVSLLQEYIDLGNTQIAGLKTVLESFGKTFISEE